MSETTDPTVLGEVVCKSLTIVDEHGQQRIILEVIDGEASVVVVDEDGRSTVSLRGSDRQLGLMVDDGRRMCDVTAGGIEVSAAGGPLEARIDAMGDRIRHLADLAGKLNAERDGPL